MGIDPKQLRAFVIRPALEEIGLHSDAAEELVLGTAAHESHCGQYLRQVKGPALGIFQMEPATYKDIWANWLPGHGQLADDMRQLSVGPLELTGAPSPEEMVWNLKFAAAMCRVFYRRIKAPLPAAGDLAGQAAYWKQYYNTKLGKGTPAQYVQAWQNLVA